MPRQLCRVGGINLPIIYLRHEGLSFRKDETIFNYLQNRNDFCIPILVEFKVSHGCAITRYNILGFSMKDSFLLTSRLVNYAVIKLL